MIENNIKIKGRIPEEAKLGFLRIKLKVSEDWISPAILNRNSLVVYPKCEEKNYFIIVMSSPDGIPAEESFHVGTPTEMAVPEWL